RSRPAAPPRPAPPRRGPPYRPRPRRAARPCPPPVPRPPRGPGHDPSSRSTVDTVAAPPGAAAAGGALPGSGAAGGAAAAAQGHPGLGEQPVHETVGTAGGRGQRSDALAAVVAPLEFRG